MAAPIDPVSLATVRVVAIDQSGARHSATGFLYSLGERTHLVTNWHVMTGRRPSNRAISETGALITHVEIEYHWTPDQERVAPYRFVKDTCEVLDPTTKRGNWIEHQDSDIDVALLPIQLPENALTRSLDRIEFDKFDHSVGEDVFVVGFPQGLSIGDTTLPLWKGGSIASEPSVPVGRKPKHLIDCDTYEGMSGSPVIVRRQSGSFRFNASGQLTDDSTFGEVRKFLGVYTGRVEQQTPNIQEPYLKTKFGEVWSAEVIREILENPLPGAILR